MLEGLDQVHWHLLKHSYGSAKDVPELLQKISTAQDDEVFKKYFWQLMNEIHHQDDIFNAAPAVIPFFIQLLSQATFKYKFSLLVELKDFFESSKRYLRLPRLHSHGFGEWHDCIAIQQTIYANLRVYLNLLKDSESEVRRHAARLLGILADQRHKIRLPLVRAIQKEQDAAIAASMVYDLIDLIPFSHHGSAHRVWKQYTLLLFHWVEAHPDEIVRLTAADVWVEIYPRYLLETTARVIPISIVNSIKKIYLDSENRRYHPILETLNKLGIHVLAEVLAETVIPPDSLHDIARLMLLKVFDPILTVIHAIPNENFWYFYEGRFYEEPHQRIYDIYAYNRSGWRVYDPATEKLVEVQQFVLNAIIHCDRFWELPTNLFSFFFGLPDDRDTLRALVAKNQG